MIDVEIRQARDGEASAISAVVLAALRVSNARDYAPDIVERVASNLSPAALETLMKSRTVFVATIDDRFVGTASLDGRALRTMFVSPDMQGRGVGKWLVAAVEELARRTDVQVLALASSITVEPFCAKLGYRAVRDAFHGAERTIVMERALGPR